MVLTVTIEYCELYPVSRTIDVEVDKSMLRPMMQRVHLCVCAVCVDFSPRCPCAGLVGVQVSNMNQSYEGRLPYVNMVLMLLVDAVLYFLLAWYLDQVKSGAPPEL